MAFLIKYVKMYWKQYLLALTFLTLEAICDLMQPTIMSRIIDKGVASKNINLVLYLGGTMLLVTGIGAVAAVIRNIVSSRVSQSFGSKLRSDLFKKVQSFSFENVDRFQAASLMTRLTNDITQVQNFANGMMRIFVKAPILCIGSIVMAVMLNPYMSLILIGVIPIMSFAIFMNMKLSYPIFIKMQEALDRINSVMREYLSGIRVVKAFNRFNYETEHFENANDNLSNISIKGMRVLAFFNPCVTLTVNIGIVLVIWIGGIRVSYGKMQVGQIIAFVNYMTQILFSLMMISNVITMFIRARASAQRIGEVFSQENNLLEIEKTVVLEEPKGKIEFENVYFSYKGAKGDPVLKNISFKCSSGETLGIIGSTGSGKSTLVNLIPRFYDVISGAINIDGVNVKEMSIKELRDNIAVVPQKTVLFTGTIIDNIKWGNENADDKEVEEAAEISEAHGFITSFKNGYNTTLGQGGVNVSGGQKQRISIARAIIKKPKILILDDCTSAVDVVTEGRIRAKLKAYSSNTTCLLIAQRITSVMGCDKIMVLDNGEIVGMGTHKELMDSCSIYQDIFNSQLGKGVEDFGA